MPEHHLGAGSRVPRVSVVHQGGPLSTGHAGVTIRALPTIARVILVQRASQHGDHSRVPRVGAGEAAERDSRVDSCRLEQLGVGA